MNDTGHRSVGLYFVCLLCGVRAVWSLLGGAGLVLVGGMAAGAGAGGAGAAGLLFGLALIAIGFGLFAAIGGLWTGSTFGWGLAVAVFALDAVLAVAMIAGGAGGFFALVVDVLVLGYLAVAKGSFGSSVDRREMVPDHH